MQKITILLFTVLLAGFARFAAAETIKFDSYDTGDHQDIFSGDWKKNAFESRANLVQANDASAPLVINNPGWGGGEP